MSQTPPHRKLKPQHQEGVSPVFLGLVGLLGLIMIAIGMAAAGSDDLVPDPTPTSIPAPVLGDGRALQVGDEVYLIEAANLSFFAATEQENPDLALEKCARLAVLADEAGLYFFEDMQLEAFYWVYVSVPEQTGYVGWLPFQKLSPTPPEGC
jgi:hypothetical protein